MSSIISYKALIIFLAFGLARPQELARNQNIVMDGQGFLTSMPPIKKLVMPPIEKIPFKPIQLMSPFVSIICPAVRFV